MIKKDVFSSCHERGTKEKFWVPMRNSTSDLRICALIWGSIPRGDSEFFLCPTLVTRRKNILLNSLLSSKLPSLLFLSKINDILISYLSICSFIHITHSVTHSLTHSVIHSMVVHQVECLNVAIHFFLIQKLHKIFWKWWKSAPTDLKERSVPLPTWRQDKWWFKVIC